MPVSPLKWVRRLKLETFMAVREVLWNLDPPKTNRPGGKHLVMNVRRWLAYRHCVLTRESLRRI